MLDKIKRLFSRVVPADTTLWPDTGAGVSRLDELDGVHAGAHPAREAAFIALAETDTPTHAVLGVYLAQAVPDTGLIAAALSDGDNPALRDEVYLTPTGGLVHHDLGGAR